MVLASTRDRYLSFGEHCSRKGDRRSDPLPPELAISWRPCELCPCFYYRTAADLQRHFHLSHFNSNLSLNDCDKSPFGCSYRLERKTDEAGVPYGPFQYCGMRFTTSAALKRHKEDEGHTRKRALAVAAPLAEHAAAQAVPPQAEQPAPPPAVAEPVQARRGRKRKEAEDDNEVPERELRKKARRRGLSPEEAAAELLRGERDQLVRFKDLKRADKQIRALFGSAVRSESTIKRWKKVLNSKDVTVDSLVQLIDEMLVYIEGEDAEGDEGDEDGAGGGE